MFYNGLLYNHTGILLRFASAPYIYIYIYIASYVSSHAKEVMIQRKSLSVDDNISSSSCRATPSISLTLSCRFSLSFIAFDRSSGLHPVSSHSCYMYIRAGRPAFARSYEGVHRSTSFMSSSLLLQPCPAYLVRQLTITRHAGHCWRSRDELIRDVFLWTPTNGPCKSRTTGTNIHSAAMWGYGMLSWRPA